MKVNKSHSLIWFILLSVNFALGSPAISNITITPNQGTGTITISYSIEGITNTAEVTARASIDGGSSYSVSLSNATGAVGSGITNGSGKTIVWQADQDLPNGGPFEMRIKLDAIEESSSSGGSGSSSEDYPEQDFSVSSAYKLPKTGCTWDSPHLPYDDGELQIGRDFSFTDNGDGTVTDNNTGLMWIQDFYIGRNGGNGFTSDEEANDFVEALEYAGYDDWRMASQREILFIMQETDESINAFSSQYFKNYKPSYMFTEDTLLMKETQNSSYYMTIFGGSAKLEDFNYDFYFENWWKVTNFGLENNSQIYLHNRGWYKELNNLLIVRGDDRTKPEVSVSSSGIDINDLNNNLIYKKVSLEDIELKNKIIEYFKSKDSYEDVNLLNIVSNYFSVDEEYFGYRVPNCNELINLTEVMEVETFSSTILPYYYKNPCNEVRNQDICQRGFAAVAYNESGKRIIKDFDNQSSNYPRYFILVKSL